MTWGKNTAIVTGTAQRSGQMLAAAKPGMTPATQSTV
jgi:hypothetical protein